MNRQIEKQIRDYRNDGIVLYVHDNGQPNYFNDKADAKRVLDFAFATGELDSDTYDDLVEELNELKF